MLSLSAHATATEPTTEPAWRSASQLLLVTSTDWDATEGELRTFERVDGEWRASGAPTPVMLGRTGMAWGIGLHAIQPGLQKREGDGRAPAGVFALGIAFGYADGAATAMRYTPMRASHWCIDVPESPLYNLIVDTDTVGASATAGSTEPMRRDLHLDGDQRYRKGFVIEHNPSRIAGAGSCIFAHLWKAPGVVTAGCTAMDEAAMDALLHWLDPAAQPVLVALPRSEYMRLHETWALPSLSTGTQQ